MKNKSSYQEQFCEYLLEESSNTLKKDVAMKISISVVDSLDWEDPYVMHKSLRQRAKNIIPKIKKEYFTATYKVN